ncbi:magnesium transporter NIPA-domain-containing protein [Mycena vulgaris]|nr:magnesium transporter NIPA-domain-containing protein [Mycena vulgaris]
MTIAGPFAIGTSSVITKMVSVQNVVVGEVANFGTYTVAPPVMVTPLGALSVIVGAIFASFLLNERLGHLGSVGCALCILGSSIIVLHAPEGQDLETVTQVLKYAVEPGAHPLPLPPPPFCLVSTPHILRLPPLLLHRLRLLPRHGVRRRSNTRRHHPLVYISIASFVGSVSVMFIKGFSVALKRSRGTTMIQLNYANRALDLFSVNLVNSIYYVGFCTATIVASLILFKGFNTTSAFNTVSLLSGFVVTFLGVHILNMGMFEESASHSPTSINGAVALDDGSPWNHGRARRDSRGSLNALRTPLFGAFAIETNEGGLGSAGAGIGRLQRLLEEEEDGFVGEDADERTPALRGSMKFGLSLLAFCGSACALSVPSSFPPAHVAKVIGAQAYMAGNETSVATEKRNLGTVFLCNAAFFSGYCVAITGGLNGGCIDLAADLDNQVSSFGPDPGQSCEPFNSHGCGTPGTGAGFIRFPGVQDFSQSWTDSNGNVHAPFNDVISSYSRSFWQAGQDDLDAEEEASATAASPASEPPDTVNSSAQSEATGGYYHAPGTWPP